MFLFGKPLRLWVGPALLYAGMAYVYRLKLLEGTSQRRATLPGGLEPFERLHAFNWGILVILSLV